MLELDTMEDLALRELWITLLDASERSLRGVLFYQPNGIYLDRRIGEEDIKFWFKKVPLCFIAWIYYGIGTKSKADISGYLYFKDDSCGGLILDIYESLFGKSPKCSKIQKYATGLKEDDEREISLKGDLDTVEELMFRDYDVIGRELLEEIWNIDTRGIKICEEFNSIKSNEDTIAKKMLFIGGRLWQAHKQIIQPLLFSENTDMDLFKNQFGSKTNNTPKDSSKIDFSKYFYIMNYSKHYAEFLEGVPDKSKVISELFLFRAWTTQFGFRMFSPNEEISEKVIYEIVNQSNTLGKGCFVELKGLILKRF